MFYNVQRTKLTFVGKKINYAILPNSKGHKYNIEFVVEKMWDSYFKELNGIKNKK